jgi:hypothetical protein
MTEPLMTEEQLAAVIDARKVLIRSLEKRYPSRLAEILTCVAISGQFANLVAASSGRADLVDVINRQLADVGLKLVPTPRH